MDKVPQLKSKGWSPTYGDYRLNPNALNGQYGSVPQGTGSAPGFLSQFWSALNGAGTMNPLMNILTGGVGGLISTGLNLFTQNWQNKQAIDMWNMENEYNTPQNQIQRFLDAGINPAQAVDAVTSGQNTAGSLQPGQNPSQAPDLMSMMGNSANNSLGQQLLQAQVDTQKAQEQNLKADADLKKSQDVGQQIENANRQDIINSTLRAMQDKHEIDSQTAHALARDNAMEDMLFSGRIQMFWVSLAQACQDLVNAEAEHERIIADINLRYSEIALNANLAVESDARTQLALKQKEIEEENRRYMKFRNDTISKYHFDPQSPVQQNIGFALAIGDTETADYWMNHLGRLQANIDGWSEEQKGFLSQQFTGYKGLLDMVKFMAGGYVAGNVAKGSKMSVDARGNVTPPAGYRVGKVTNYGKVSNYYTDPMTTYDVFNPGSVQYK